MKVLSIKEPFASLVSSGIKKLRPEVGKQTIEGKYTFMLVLVKPVVLTRIDLIS